MVTGGWACSVSQPFLNGAAAPSPPAPRKAQFTRFLNCGSPAALAGSARPRRRGRWPPHRETKAAARTSDPVRDITNPRLLVLKAVLFVILGLGAAAILIAQAPRISTALLLTNLILGLRPRLLLRLLRHRALHR